MQEFWQNLWTSVKDFFITRWNQVFVFLMVLIFGFIVVKLLVLIFRRGMNRSKLKGAAGDFITSLVKALLYLIWLIALLALLGVPTTSMIAVLSAFALAISLALQGTFSNVASGIVIVVTKPFIEGDYIDVGGTAGTVETITIFSTKLVTPDNKAVIIPNSTVASANITNFSAKDMRRLDLKISTAYGTDIEKVKEVVLGVIKSHEETLKDPAPTVRLAEHGNSALVFTVRTWVRQKDYWPMNFDLQEEIVAAFAKEGIQIPYQQIDVHMK